MLNNTQELSKICVSDLRKHGTTIVLRRSTACFSNSLCLFGYVFFHSPSRLLPLAVCGKNSNEDHEPNDITIHLPEIIEAQACGLTFCSDGSKKRKCFLKREIRSSDGQIGIRFLSCAASANRSRRRKTKSVEKDPINSCHLYIFIRFHCSSRKRVFAQSVLFSSNVCDFLSCPSPFFQTVNQAFIVFSDHAMNG